MGIVLNEALNFLNQRRVRNMHGSLLTLGRQDCHFTFEQLVAGMMESGHVQSDGTTAVLTPAQAAV